MGINKVVCLFVLLAAATAAVLIAASHNTLEVRAQANAWRSSGPMSAESFPCVAIDPGNSNTVYAGVTQRGLGLSGVFKSVDGGANWNPTGMSSLSVTELAIDPTRPSTIYAAVSSVTAAGIYKSTDAGVSWTLTGYRFGASALAIDPKQPNTIYVGAGSGGVYKSTDGGVTWSRPNSSFIQSFHSMLLDPENPQVIYGATQNNGVFKSADGGVTWNPTAPIDRNTSRPWLAIDPKNTSVLYAAYLDIYKTTNGGSSWTKINNNLADPAASAVAIDPSNPNTVYIGTYASRSPVYKSTNGGASWSEFSAGLPQRSVLSLVIDRAGTSLHAGLESGGVYDYRYDGAVAAVTTVSAASYSGSTLARESIAAAFGSNLATTTQLASTIPLPTSIAGTTVRVKDSAGAERLAPLFFVAPTQINCLIPAGTANGEATVTTISGNGSTSAGTIRIESVAPGLFSADATGQGIASAVVLRVRADGSQSYEPVSQFDPAQNRFVAIPLDLGPATDQIFLILFGTGIRFRGSLSAVSARIGGADAQVSYAGPVIGLVGLDQVNLSVPRSLAGRGEVDIAITADGKTANTVQVSIGPVTAQTPTITSISPNSVDAGSSAFTLTVNGANFVNGSVVRWGGNGRATTFVSSTQLRATILASDIASAGTASVTVFNPGGGVSNSLPFSITQACAYSILPTSQSFSALGGSGSVNVTATGGCNWSASSNASWITINSGSSGSGSGTLTFSVVANPNTAQRTGTLTIAFQTFTVVQAGANNPVPAITSLSPNSATAAGPAFTLTINGTGFIPGSIVRWNGGNRTTTFVTGTQLRADIPASDIVAAGTAAVTVFNPAPGGGVSNTLNLTITPSSQGSGPFTGGTFYDRSSGVIGTAFLFNPVTPSGVIPYVDVQGPAGWNSNRQLRVSRSQLPGMAAERSIGWTFTQPVTGEYAAVASTGGQSYESRASINATNTLPAPEITELTVSPGQVTFRWTANSAAQSFLVRINPLPFAGSITREVIVPGNSRTVTLNGLSLASGTTYQALVFAFSLDVRTPGPIAGQFNVSTHSINFTAPQTNYFYSISPTSRSFAAGGGRVFVKPPKLRKE